MRTAIVTQPIDPAALLAECASSRNGAALLFLGTVRDINDGQPVTALDYSAYDAMAGRELSAIASEAATRWDTTDIVVEHRTGELGLGDISVAIVVAHPHRGPAYDASRYIIEELKKRLPIWKREHYADGTTEWVPGSTQAAEAVPPPAGKDVS